MVLEQLVLGEILLPTSSCPQKSIPDNLMTTVSCKNKSSEQYIDVLDVAKNFLNKSLRKSTNWGMDSGDSCTKNVKKLNASELYTLKW